MNNHPHDILTVETGASFIFTPCPGTKDASLEESLSQLKQAGAQAIITLMYQSEIEKHQATELPNICQQYGVKWFQLPISDDAAPNEDFVASWQSHKSEIVAMLKDQGTIALHCKGGSGRTGLVIGLLMNELGLSKQQAKALVQSVRPKALVNVSQLSFYERFAN